jgi:hypothetical protein
VSDPRFISSLIGTQSLFGTNRPVAHGGMDLSGYGMPGQMAGMFMTPFMSQMGMQAGMMPGQFQPIQNFYDQHQARMAALTQNTAMAAQREADRNQLHAMTRNALMLTSRGPLTGAQDRMAGDMADAVTKFLPTMAAMAPGMVDQMFGTRGSGTVFAMGAADASRLMAGPGGMTGLSPDQAAALAKQVHQQLYGPGANPSDMRGIGGAAAGQMMAEMSRRGLMGTDGATPGGGMDAASVGLFHSGRAAARVKEMAGAVSAMRDIFGDAGRGDAPMQELIAGLERLTQGGMATMDRNRMEDLVRRTHQMAKMSGVGMDAIHAMSGASAGRLEAAGVDRSMALDITNSSLAFATAYGQVGGGASPGWRKASKEKLMAMDQRLRETAAGSATAHQMGAIMMLGDQGLLTEGPALALYQAGKKGDFSGMGYLEPDKFSALLRSSGVSAGMANQALLDTKSTQEYIQRYRLQDVARDRQMDTDLKPMLSQLAQQSAGAVLEGRGLGRGLSGKAGSVIVEALTRMSEKTRGNATDRTDALILALEAGLGADGVAGLGANPAARKQALREMAVSGWNNLEEGIQTMPSLAGFEGANNLFALMSPKAAAQRRGVMAQAEARAGMSRALSGVGVGGPMQRLIDELTSGEPTDVKKLALRFFGSVDRADGIGALKTLFAGSSEKYKRLKVLGAESEKVASDMTLGDAERARKMEAINTESKKLEAELHTLTEGTDAGGAEKLAKEKGVSVLELLKGEKLDGTKLDEKDVAKARAMAGSSATAKAMGLSDEAGAIAKKAQLDELREKAAPNRKAALASLATVRDKLVAEGKRKGLFGTKTDAELTDEDLAKVGSDTLSDVDAPLRKMLTDKGIGLDEYKKAIEADEKHAKDRELSLRGELRLIPPDGAVITATGVPAP